MKRVVIAGAGFAGVRVARRLAGKANITVIAPTDRFVYLPLIHELISERETPPSVSKRLVDILPNARLVEDRVVAVEGDEAVTGSGQRYPFDHFVHAAGAEPNDYGVPGVRDHTFSFYSIRDALLANGHLKAAAASVYGRRPRVLIVGASFTGVEVAGEVRDLMKALDVECDIELLEAGQDIFLHQSPAFRREVWKALQAMELRVHLGRRVAIVNEGVVIATGGKRKQAIVADVILWCAGARPRTIDGVDPNVRNTLQSVTRDNVWVAGDAAQFPPEMAVPRRAQTAEPQATVVAHNILHPHRMRAYIPSVRGIIISVGRTHGIAEVRGAAVLSGTIPWHIKRRLYQAKIRLT